MWPLKGTKKPRAAGRFAALAWPQTHRGRRDLFGARLPLLVALHALLARPGVTPSSASLLVAREHLAGRGRCTSTGEAANLARMLRRDYSRAPAYIAARAREWARAQAELDRHWRAQGELDRANKVPPRA